MHKSQPILPPPLSPGATIGIIAPSGRIKEDNSFTQGIKILHELGFITKFPRNLWPGCDYLADSDQNRLAEITEMWNDSEVDAIMAARGGYGCLRIADGFSKLSLADSPKWLIGFSDITVLHHSMLADHGMISFHGPVVTSLPRLDKTSIESFHQMLLSDMKSLSLSFKPEVLRNGEDVAARLAGGNLSSIVSTLGTPFSPDWDEKIVVLEDTSEPAYRVDKMFTQLHMAGLFDKVKAIILGDFSEGLALDHNGKRNHTEMVWKRLMELLAETIPVWGDFPVGHGSDNITLPLGMHIIMDSSRRVLRRA